MNIFNINVPKDRISMIFDAFGDSENYSTTLYLYKSKINFEEEGNKYSAQLEIDLKQDTKKDKMVKQTFNKEYGSFIITFLNADFSNAESAYNSFFIYYGLEGFDSIDKIKEKYPMIRLFVLVNALVEQKYLDDLKNHLDKLNECQIDGIIFQDFGVLQICNEKGYSFEKIYDPETLNTNHLTLSVLKEQGIDGAFLAREIPLKEKQMIGQNCKLKTMVQVHGVEYMAYSKRKLLSNYKEYTHLDFNVDKEAQIEIKANGVEDHCHIYEDQYGTHITSTNQMCALDVLNQFNDFDYLYIDGQYINETDLLEITHLYIQAIEAIKNQTYSKESIELMQLLYRLTPNVHYYHSFLFDSTVYKISDVRKREENERS